MRNRNVASILAVALVLPGALALPAGRAGAKAAKDLGSVKRELWTAEAGLAGAVADLRGLQALAGDSQAYEAKLATQLRDRAAKRLLESEQHLSQLWKVPGQDDATLRQVASLQDAVRRARERVQKMGPATRAQVDPRPDTRRGSSAATRDAGTPEGPQPGQGAPSEPPEASMPPANSEAMLDLRAELKALIAQLGSVEDQARKLTERYGIADELNAP